jgi:benzoyl-CoA reductase/2-hydroxyglutaryl-CoA dehydratase subunit BcrC/BadD/HgdB
VQQDPRIAEMVEWFDNATDWAQIDFKNAKTEGRKVIGLYCGYVPSELVRAAGAIPVSLCGDAEEAIAPAEVDLPRNFCPLVKSSYGLAITDTCPYFHFSDALIGETTCDGKKKVFELLRSLKPVHVMQLPFDAERPGAREQWRAEIGRISAFIEEVTGNAIDPDVLRDEIRRSNEMRDLLASVDEQFLADDPPMTWTQMLTVMHTGDFLVEREPYVAKLRELDSLLRELASEGTGRKPRVMVTGTPMSPDTNKVMRIAEESGARVVVHDACSGIKCLDRRIDETIDPYDALTDYTLGIPCACMSPNPGRGDLLKRSVERYRVAGVIDTVWQGCHTFNVESVHVGRITRAELGLPYLKIETDYSENDTEQLRTRIEAFVEQLD